MKKRALLFGMFLSSVTGSELHAATDELHIDQLKLDVRTDHIVGSLWRNDQVLDDDIEEAFSAISVSSREHSDASSDDGKKPDEMHRTQDAEISSFIEEFDEVTKEITKDRRKTEAQTTSLKDFIERVRSRGARNDPIAVKYVLRTIAEKY